jgi:hypothetical protein
MPERRATAVARKTWHCWTVAPPSDNHTIEDAGFQVVLAAMMPQKAPTGYGSLTCPELDAAEHSRARQANQANESDEQNLPDVRAKSKSSGQAAPGLTVLVRRTQSCRVGFRGERDDVKHLGRHRGWSWLEERISPRRMGGTSMEHSRARESRQGWSRRTMLIGQPCILMAAKVAG